MDNNGVIDGSIMGKGEGPLIVTVGREVLIVTILGVNSIDILLIKFERLMSNPLSTRFLVRLFCGDLKRIHTIDKS